jgi:hypothetical protein
MTHKYYSQRKGTNPNQLGLSLPDVVGLFLRVYKLLRDEGYFDEAFGYYCVDAGELPGKVKDVQLEILLNVRKKNLWPIEEMNSHYSEDDFFDVLEFLFQHVSKPIDGTYHSWNDCGMHWETFNKEQGQTEFCERINAVLSHYAKPFELSSHGEILHKPEFGFEPIFEADIPTEEEKVKNRINSAVLFRFSIITLH